MHISRKNRKMYDFFKLFFVFSMALSKNSYCLFYDGFYFMWDLKNILLPRSNGIMDFGWMGDINSCVFPIHLFSYYTNQTGPKWV